MKKSITPLINKYTTVLSIIVIMHLLVIMLFNVYAEVVVVTTAVRELLAVPVVLINILLIGLYAADFCKRSTLCLSLAGLCLHLVLLGLVFWII